MLGQWNSESDDDDETNRLVSRQQQSTAVDAFHQDMRRMLESRSLAEDAEWQLAATERRRKPTILKSDQDGAERSLLMLKHLRDTMKSATEESYQIVMRAFLSRGRLRWRRSETPSSSRMERQQKQQGAILCAADQLEELLEDLQQHQQQTSVISTETYNLVLQSYAICSTPRGDRNYAERAEALLERMGAAATTESHLHVLHAYAWQQANRMPGDCAAKAHEKLTQICRMAPDDAAIQMQAHAWVMEAWSKSTGGAGRCMELLDAMKELNATCTNNNNDASQFLDAEVYSNAILAWSKTENGPENAHNLLLELINKFNQGAFHATDEPPLIAFNSVVTAWGRYNRADKVDEVMQLLETTRQKYPSLESTTILYNSILHSILSGPLENDVALQKSLRLVDYMEEQSDTRPAIAPDCYSYYTLLKCWIQSSEGPKAAEEAEQLLRRMERLWATGDVSVAPSTFIYNIVMNAFAKSKHRYAHVHALDLLKRMKTSRHADCRPDIISYTSAIECISKSSDPEAPALAEKLLGEAIERYKKTGDPALMPNLRTYTMAIQTLAKNNGSVVQARALLTRLLEQYEKEKDPKLKPNTYPYNYVLNCAANTLDDKFEAFQIASQTFQEMRKSKHVRPDSYSYAFWLKCCNNLLDRGTDLRIKCVQFAFEECKSKGLVTNEVLARLFQGNPPQLVDALLELEPSSSSETSSGSSDQKKKPLASLSRQAGIVSYRNLRVQDLPPSWSRNTKRQR